ncbi:outer dense fiber protein 2-like isoform X1 [Thalassophryne amazonica]|uniref:outer dense fiber protein 2-like isoform X1 n=1 Tax=Thalassophryne amazonica TaxID=390379 RepID=UPI001470A420|nr:outer dense fiber protein 2-like isoform X1 [Thalassophryne amazonica]
MSPEDALRRPSLGFSLNRNYVPLSSSDLNASETSTRNNRNPEYDVSCSGHFSDDTGMLMKMLIEAEAAANSVAVQLMSFKDTLEDECFDSRHSAAPRCRIKRQRELFLEKLENFKQTNKSVRRKLKQLQQVEADGREVDKQIGVLLKKISQAESENAHLKKDLNDAEKRVEELVALRTEEQENAKTAVLKTKAVQASRAHLHGQLRNKEAENNRLTVRLQSLERALIRQKMENKDLKHSITILCEKEVQEKDSLKKAAQSHKRRAERFEAAIEKCYAQIREKDVLLASAQMERDSRRNREKQITAEKDKLVGHVETLKCQIAEMNTRQQREKEELIAANEIVMQRIEKLITENGDLSISNATLKGSVAQLEQQLSECEAALVEEKAVSEDRKRQAEQCHNQVAEVQAEVADLRIKYANILKQVERTQNRNDTEFEKMRQELQDRVHELKDYPELLRAAEQKLLEWQEKLRCSAIKSREKSESIKQMQIKMESQNKMLRSAVEMKESVHEANLQLQEKVISLQKKIDELQQENQELVLRLAAREEALTCSNRELEQRSSECQTLSRQLDTVLSDAKLQVNKIKSQAADREEVLQTKILELEAGQRQRFNELTLLRQSKVMAGKQFEVRLKDMQLSLDHSESHKQSIENYVEFLKDSFRTMFDEELQGFGSSQPLN